MPSGWYMPNTGQFPILIEAVLPGPDWSDGSNPFPVKLWFLNPKGNKEETVAVLILTTAKALFSWQVTQAVELSSEMAMYSGSISSATVEFLKKVPPDCILPVILMLGLSVAGELKAVKPAV